MRVPRGGTDVFVPAQLAARGDATIRASGVTTSWHPEPRAAEFGRPLAPPAEPRAELRDEASMRVHRNGDVDRAASRSETPLRPGS
jgi:hypothetical protein